MIAMAPRGEIQKSHKGTTWLTLTAFFVTRCGEGNGIGEWVAFSFHVQLKGMNGKKQRRKKEKKKKKKTLKNGK